MRIKIAIIVLIFLYLSPAAFGQSAILKGKVTKLIKDKEEPFPHASVVSPDGQAAQTDSKGQFIIKFPVSVRPGIPTRVEVRNPNWVIYQPFLGECVTMDKTRNFKELLVQVVRKGSPLALSRQQLPKVIARWASELKSLRNQAKDQKQQLDEYAFLREYSEKYGFTLEQFREAADKWANNKIAANKIENGWKEYWKKNYSRAAQLGRESRMTFQEILKRDKEKRLENGRQFISSANLEGDARYAEDKFRESLDAYQAIEAAFLKRELLKDDFPAEWSITKNSIGAAKSELGKRVEGKESQTLLTEAVASLREALRDFHLEQSPELWAALQSNLGVILLLQGQRSSGKESLQLLGEAEKAFNDALKVRKKEQSPQFWAMTQSNLGNCLMLQSQRSTGELSMRRIENAISAFTEVLKIRNKFSEEWASTQSNLGNALAMLGERSQGPQSIDFLRMAANAFQEALKVRTLINSEQDWADTQNNLGNALVFLGERIEPLESKQSLSQAVEIYEKVLKVRNREKRPQDWADTQNNLGGALLRLAERSEGFESLNFLIKAEKALEQALEVRKPTDLPQDWAATQNNLGVVLMMQGESEFSGGTELLKKAEAAFRAALTVRTPTHLPLDWAMTHNNLGSVLELQGKQLTGSESIRLLSAAIETFRETLSVYTYEHFPQNWAQTQNNLGNALRAKGERLNGDERAQSLLEAEKAFRKALTVMTREKLFQGWVTTQINLARTYFAMESWQNAAACYESLLLEFFSQGLISDEIYQALAEIYHEKLFDFEKAYALHKKVLSLVPEHKEAKLNSAETHFTAARFAEFAQQIKPLLNDSAIPRDAKIPLQMIEVANLLALDQAAQMPAALTGLRETIAAQRADFRITWSFAGTLHFINQHEKLASHRTWLNQFFGTAQAENRDAILKALREAQAQFPSAK